MSWTDPRTWTTAEVVTASIMNTHVRDNLNYLYDSDWHLISSATPSSSAVSFTNIPQTFRDLRIVGQLRAASANQAVAVGIRFNNDVGSTQYIYEYVESNTATVAGAGSSNASFSEVGVVAAASATSGYGGLVDLVIPSYAGTTFEKMVTGTSCASASGFRLVKSVYGHWKSTAAISRIDLIDSTASSSTFASGVVTLEGRASG